VRWPVSVAQGLLLCSTLLNDREAVVRLRLAAVAAIVLLAKSAGRPAIFN
jgi:hypothetical protein